MMIIIIRLRTTEVWDRQLVAFRVMVSTHRVTSPEALTESILAIKNDVSIRHCKEVKSWALTDIFHDTPCKRSAMQ